MKSKTGEPDVVVQIEDEVGYLKGQMVMTPGEMQRVLDYAESWSEITNDAGRLQVRENIAGLRRTVGQRRKAGE